MIARLAGFSFALLLSGLFVWSTAAAADETKANCKLYPKGGVLKTSYKLIGPAACLAECKKTDGCTAWSYTAHNFRPKKAPGQCRLLKDVAEEKKSRRADSCGYVKR